MIEIIPTVVPVSIDDVATTALRYKDFAPVIHIDVADGVFAPNTTWMPKEGELLPHVEGVSYEAHLMVADPLKVGLAFAHAGAVRIIGHLEAMQGNGTSIFDAWKSAGAREVGAGMLFATSLEQLDELVDACDVVQMMSITSIGVQGIPYEPTAPERIAALQERHPELLIAVDGGVNESNIAQLGRAGVRRFCVGSVLSKSPDPASTYARLVALAEAAVQ